MSVLVKPVDHIKLPPWGHNLMVVLNPDGLVNLFAESDICNSQAGGVTLLDCSLALISQIRSRPEVSRVGEKD